LPTPMLPATAIYFFMASSLEWNFETKRYKKLYHSTLKDN
jgi:hypothetical protein